MFSQNVDYSSVADTFQLILCLTDTLHLCYIGLVVLCLCASLLPSPNKNCTTKTHLQALSTVVVPLNAAAIACIPHRIHKQTIILPLTSLTKEVFAGNIEMRNTPDDLFDLFSDDLRAYGYKITLDIEDWRPRILAWLLKAHFHKTTHIPTPEPLSLSRDPNTVYLDLVPHANILRTIQDKIRSSNVTLEFTTLSRNTTWMSREFMLCAVPFLQRGAPPSPLLSSLVNIVSAHAHIKAVENISQQHSALLKSREHDLVEDATIRSQFIKQFGLELWREHRFLLAWEAALLDVGLISRWIVVLLQG